MIAHLRIEKRPDIPNDPSLKTNSNKIDIRIVSV
jgi:hypothetical protein